MHPESNSPETTLRGQWTRAAVLVGLLALVTLPCASASAARLRADSGVHFGGNAIAAPRGALSLSTNPAGLSTLNAFEARLQLAAGGAWVGGTRGAGWGSFLALPLGAVRLGLSAERVSDVPPGDGAPGALSVTRMSMGAAVVLGERLHLGVAARVHSRVEGWPTSWDLGLLYRPWTWLSLGVRATGMARSSVDQGGFGGPLLHTRWGWGLAVRPIGASDRLTLAWDVTWPAGEQRGSMTGQARVRVVDGLSLMAELQRHRHNVTTGDGVGDDTRFSLLVDVGLGHWGTEVGVRSDNSAVNGEKGGVQLGVRLSGDVPRSLVDAGDEAVVVPLEGAYSEAPINARFFGRLLLRLDALADDPAVRTVVFRADGPRFTWSQVEELRAAVARLRSRGKRTAWYAASIGTRGYMVASACERIGMPETGTLAARGFGADFVGLSEALTKVGVSVQALRFGQHKSAPEMFTRKHISATLRATYQRIIQARWQAFVTAVAAGRSLTPEQVEAALGRGVTFPADARAALLIDAVAEPKAFEKQLRDWGLLARGARLARFTPLRMRRTRWGRQDKIAVVAVTGTIVDGRSGAGVEGKRVGGAAIARTLDRLHRRDDVRGVVARIDSGGGAVWGSDAMYQALLRFSRDKPTAASMASMAASGGYWTALGADKIFATRATITGSIGIWVAKPDISGLLARLGVGNSHVGIGPHDGVTSLRRPWTRDEQALLRRVLGRYYDLFLSRVTLRRKIPRAKLLTLAEGRLWLGDEAKTHKLVDYNGGLLAAIAGVRAQADVADDRDVRVVFLPRPTLSLQLRRAIGVAQPDAVRSLLRAAGPWLDRATVLAHLPRGAPLAIAPVHAEPAEP